MDGVAANDAAERDGAVVAAALALRGIERDRDGAGNFKRPGHADALDLGLGRLERRHRAGQERVGDVVVIARLDDEDAGAVAVAFVTLASPRPGHRSTPIAARW